MYLDSLFFKEVKTASFFASIHLINSFLFHLIRWIFENRNLVQLDTNADFLMRQHVILATTVPSFFRVLPFVHVLSAGSCFVDMRNIFCKEIRQDLY